MSTNLCGLGSQTPWDPRRSTVRYEASLRRAAARLGLKRPAVITANPLH